MNSYIFLRRIKGPVIIVVVGITALLDQWHILSYGQSWPLYLIAIGLLMLAERAAWSRVQYSQYPGQYPPRGNSGQGNWGGPSGPSSTALTVAPPSIPEDEGRK